MQSTDINIEELLTWYGDAGVDIALQDEPINRFVQIETPVETGQNKPSLPTHEPKTEQRQATAPRQERAVPDSNAIAQAVEAAKAATSLDELRKAIESFEGCNLKFTARSSVFSDGNPKSDIMIIGEAPGREEDAQGLPFVGPTGQLLDKMLAAIGLDRTSVYISAIVPWRPPGNRTPTPAESEICRPFIERHIELADPKLLFVIGGPSAQTLLRQKQGIMSLRGKWTKVQIGDREFDALPTLHPAYLLRNPAHKRLAWADLQALKAKADAFSQDTVE